MKFFKLNLKLWLPIIFVGITSAVGIYNFNHPDKVYAATPSSTNPCPGNPPPAQWKHAVVLMFENKTYSQVIGSAATPSAPFINNLVSKCGTAYSGTAGSSPKNNMHDADFKVDGSRDGTYNSKPSYATLTNGLSPTVHGLTDDNYSATTSVNNIYNQLNIAGKNARNYYSGPASSTPCASSNFSGAYHTAIRYYTNLGGQSSTPTTYCNTHDKPLSTFMSDVNSGNLPAYSMILPTNSENMHDNSIPSGDTWAQNFLTPLLDSAQYQSGDTAVFFLWDEDTPTPNVLLAPSIAPGSVVPVPTGNPISHFAVLRTIEDMLGLPLIGDTAQAPSMLPFFNGQTIPPPPIDNPPAVNITAPTNGTILTASPVTVSANATDDIGLTKVEFYVNGNLANTDTTSPYNFNWDISTLSGSQNLTAKAYDTGGHVTTSSAVNVTVSIPSGCTPPTTYGTGTIIVNAPSNTTYHVWSRINAPDTTNNSFYIQIDSSCPVVIGDSTSLPANTWSWIDYRDGNLSSHLTAALTAGNHTITLIGREPGVKLDRVLLLSDSCTPSGTGANCIDTTAPNTSLTAPTAGQTINGNVTLSANATDGAGGSGVAKVDFLVDGNIVGTATSSPYQINWNSNSVPTGNHTILAKATDLAGNVGTSPSIVVTVSAGPPGTGDLDGDGHVTSIDLSLLLNHYSQSGSGVVGDINNDSKVNVLDLSILLSNFGH
jgi:hypothetical protein